MPYPDYLGQKPKIIFFTDFDGTITQRDSCDWLIEKLGYGPEKLRQSYNDVVEGRLNFAEACREQLESVKTPWNECIEKILQDVQLDEYFMDFYRWAVSASVPVVVLSAGITPLIRAILSKLVGSEADKIEVIANEVVPRDGSDSINEYGGWKVRFRDDSDFGHDKGSTIRPYANHQDRSPSAEAPVLLYAGDGLSDLSAVKETQLLFAKAGEDLVKYCRKQEIPFKEFTNWESILETTKDIYYGRKSIAQIVKENEKKLHDTAVE